MATLPSRVLAAGVLALLAAVAVVDFALRPGRGAAADLRIARGVDRREAALLAGSPVTRAVRPWFNLLQLELFRATPEEVLLTRADWLFYAEGLAPPREPETADRLAGRVGFLREVAASAERSGARAVVWLVPAKWRLCAEHAPGLRVSPARRDLYGRVRAALLAAGVDAPDLLEDLQRTAPDDPASLWRADDTHLSGDGYARLVRRWLPAALGLTAVDVAARLDAAPRLPPRTEPGDLARLLQLPDGWADRFASPQRGWVAPPPRDAPGSDVLVVGDSNLVVWERLLPRLIQVAGAVAVDARYVEDAARGLGRAWDEYRDRPPRLLLMVVGERGFATGW
ncbi:MAG: hypothetical protein AB7O97_22935 [Planctomycetota bacterium]